MIDLFGVKTRKKISKILPGSEYISDCVRTLLKHVQYKKKLKSLSLQIPCKTDFVRKLLKKKKSDTLFVLGSGGSIVGYSEKEWSVIASHDTVGFNNWILHKYNPTFFVFELYPDDPDIDLMYVKSLSKIVQEYKNTTVILKDVCNYSTIYALKILSELPEEFRKRLYLSLNYPIPCNNEAQLKFSLRIINSMQIFSCNSQFVPSNKASLFYLVCLAVKLGYQRIILCGIDLNNTKYFYEFNEKNMLRSNIAIPHNVQSGVIHKTNDPKYGDLTISRLLNVLNDEILIKKGIKLYVGKSSSALYPQVPSFFD